MAAQANFPFTAVSTLLSAELEIDAGWFSLMSSCTLWWNRVLAVLVHHNGISNETYYNK